MRQREYVGEATTHAPGAFSDEAIRPAKVAVARDFGGTAICDNRPVRGDHLEQAVWGHVRALLEAPDRLADEYQRRLQEAQEGRAKSKELAQIEHQISALQRGISRLIDSYAAGVIERSEFEPRVAGLKTRVAQLQQRQQDATEAADAERELILVTSQLEDFATKVRAGLDTLDWLGTRDIIRTLVRRIEIDGDDIEVVFRAPPPSGSAPPPPGAAGGNAPNWQDCTGGRRALLRLARPQPPPRQGFRGHDRLRHRSPLRSLRLATHEKADSFRMSSETDTERHCEVTNKSCWLPCHENCATQLHSQRISQDTGSKTPPVRWPWHRGTATFSPAKMKDVVHFVPMPGNL